MDLVPLALDTAGARDLAMARRDGIDRGCLRRSIQCCHADRLAMVLELPERSQSRCLRRATAGNRFTGRAGLPEGVAPRSKIGDVVQRTVVAAVSLPPLHHDRYFGMISSAKRRIPS